MKEKFEELYWRCVRVGGSLEMLSLSAEQIDSYPAEKHTRLLSDLAGAIKLVSTVHDSIVNDIEQLLDEVPGEPEPGTLDKSVNLES